MGKYEDFLKNKHPNDVVVDEIDFQNIFENMNVVDFSNRLADLVGKKISFIQHGGEKTFFKKTSFDDRRNAVIVRNYRFTLFDDNKYVLYFNNIPVDISYILKVWGRRIISDVDPFGEEDWED